MPKIDSHQHFWKFDPIRDTWIPDEMALLRKDFLPHQFAPLLQENGIDGCITVQSEQAEIENVFQLENAKNNEFIKGLLAG